MGFQWMDLRIGEESFRRERERQILARLPQILSEVHDALADCVRNYADAFGPESIDITNMPHKVRVTVKELKDGKWQKTASVDVTTVPELPGLHIDRNGDALDIEVGLLPGENTFFKDGEEFLTMDELTRRMLDRALFPKLGK